MSLLFHFFHFLPLLILILTLTLHLPSLAISSNDTNTLSSSSPACPLNFTVFRDLIQNSGRPSPDISTTQCLYIGQALRLVQSHYLRRTGYFLPPLNTAESCWDSFQSLVDEFIPNFPIRSSCGFQTSWISEGCMNITTKQQFESHIPNSVLSQVIDNCNQSLENNSPCALCFTSLSNLQASYLTGPTVGNVSTCTAYPSIYAAAFANHYGPTDLGTAKCLFSLDFTSGSSSGKRRKIVLVSVLVALGVLAILVCLGFWVYWKWKMKKRILKKRDAVNVTEMASGLDSISDHTNLIKFTFDEIKKATKNFCRDNIIGRGGYGNVYKGLLPDGTEVALKRFKNCSAAGDPSFAHEVEVIASVRHVNLVALRGYCTATTPFEGHQRILVCDLVKNGSLHDHLFGSVEEKLSWPIRQRIALGTARGLAYLHYGAQPAIIHRDIKASNILLDDKFEAKVADFGLAKFTPEGMTHLSTRVAGTMGYVAPEYALYGQLTERSDVFSFGVVLLELLSGKKALQVDSDGQPSAVTDWAWSLVRNGRALDVIEDGMPELGLPEVLEKYVLIAVLCSHPQLYARPTMDQVVKLLETDISVPSIPERPIPLVSGINDIERSVSSSGSGHLSSPTGYQPYTFESDRPSSNSKEGGPSSGSM